jgi:pantetheine-phosphate adenylyltransferase
VAIGGTFDVFHKGHEQLVLKAFRLGQKVIIGITSDKYVRRQGKKHPVQAYASRVKAIRIFLRKKRLSSRALLVKLQDPYGPTATKPNVDTLVITPDTARSASKLNKLRRRKGLRPLRIHIVRLLRAEDGKPISSTRIRRREINRDGTLLKR